VDLDVGGVKEVGAVEVPVAAAAKTKIRNGAQLSSYLLRACILKDRILGLQ